MRCFLGVKTSNTTTGNAAFELIAGPNKPVHLVELTVVLATAVASEFGLGFPAAKGITPTTPVALIGPGIESLAAIPVTALAWGTGPTVPSRFHARGSLPATIGAIHTFTFDDGKKEQPNGLQIPANGSLVLWNLGTVGLFEINVICEV